MMVAGLFLAVAGWVLAVSGLLLPVAGWFFAVGYRMTELKGWTQLIIRIRCNKSQNSDDSIIADIY